MVGDLCAGIMAFLLPEYGYPAGILVMRPVLAPFCFRTRSPLALLPPLPNSTVSALSPITHTLQEGKDLLFYFLKENWLPHYMKRSKNTAFRLKHRQGRAGRRFTVEPRLRCEEPAGAPFLVCTPPAKVSGVAPLCIC